MNRLLNTIICLAAIFCCRAENPATIADHINASGIATVFQPAGLNARLMPKAAAEPATEPGADQEKPAASVGGYRIQLFSGNNARTAKSQATSRATRVDEQFPEYATYVSFDAPYWRLKVGDFRSYEEATAALARLKAAMPEYAREMRVVRDKITVR